MTNNVNNDVKRRVGGQSKRLSRTKKYLIITAVAFAVLLIGTAWWGYSTAYRTYDGDTVVIVIPQNATAEAVRDTLNARLDDYGSTVYRLWSLRGGESEKAAGMYRIAAGDRAWSVAGRIKNGRSSTVKVTFTSVRLMSDLAERVAEPFMFWDADEFLVACDSVLGPAGFAPAEYPAAFWPNTYEFYASATPVEVVKKLLDERNRFWNDERRKKAEALGLTPVEVATVASIVEEESAYLPERPVIARLYLNRLSQGMKLQADPTVKYALGDFTLRRISSKHTSVESPYNTYHVNGLPPGPIRVVDGATIDAVLDAPANDYLYMCAKEDFSGRHNFATDYATHLANAKRYQRALDARSIH